MSNYTQFRTIIAKSFKFWADFLLFIYDNYDSIDIVHGNPNFLLNFWTNSDFFSIKKVIFCENSLRWFAVCPPASKFVSTTSIKISLPI
jgi:hypothetical protein